MENLLAKKLLENINFHCIKIGNLLSESNYQIVAFSKSDRITTGLISRHLITK